MEIAISSREGTDKYKIIKGFRKVSFTYLWCKINVLGWDVGNLFRIIGNHAYFEGYAIPYDYGEIMLRSGETWDMIADKSISILTNKEIQELISRKSFQLVK